MTKRIRVLEAIAIAVYNANAYPYHNASHIRNVLNVAYALNKGKLSAELKLAILYHDIVYRQGAADNEENSAQAFIWAEKKLVSSVVNLNEGDDLPEHRYSVERVCNLIRATAFHALNLSRTPIDVWLGKEYEFRAVPLEHLNDAYILMDADLAGFGIASFGEYIQQTKKVCAEGGDEESRKKFLESLLRRESIYYTDKGFELFEKNARINIKLDLDGKCN
jgi:predicted metal-dependent HD superfamily phosphohydrolase